MTTPKKNTPKKVVPTKKVVKKEVTQKGKNDIKTLKKVVSKETVEVKPKKVAPKKVEIPKLEKLGFKQVGQNVILITEKGNFTKKLALASDRDEIKKKLAEYEAKPTQKTYDWIIKYFTAIAEAKKEEVKTISKQIKNNTKNIEKDKKELINNKNKKSLESIKKVGEKIKPEAIEKAKEYKEQPTNNTTSGRKGEYRR